MVVCVTCTSKGRPKITRKEADGKVFKIRRCTKSDPEWHSGVNGQLTSLTNMVTALPIFLE